MNSGEILIHGVDRNIAKWFSIFLETALVRRVKRLMLIRMVKLWRVAGARMLGIGIAAHNFHIAPDVAAGGIAMPFFARWEHR